MSLITATHASNAAADPMGSRAKAGQELLRTSLRLVELSLPGGHAALISALRRGECQSGAGGIRAQFVGTGTGPCDGFAIWSGGGGGGGEGGGRGGGGRGRGGGKGGGGGERGKEKEGERQ